MNPSIHSPTTYGNAGQPERMICEEEEPYEAPPLADLEKPLTKLIRRDGASARIFVAGLIVSGRPQHLAGVLGIRDRDEDPKPFEDLGHSSGTGRIPAIDHALDSARVERRGGHHRGSLGRNDLDLHELVRVHIGPAHARAATRHGLMIAQRRRSRKRPVRGHGLMIAQRRAAATFQLDFASFRSALPYFFAAFAATFKARSTSGSYVSRMPRSGNAGRPAS